MARVHFFSIVVAAAALFITITVTSTARAQVNTEPLRKRINAIGYSLVIEGSVTGSTGNTEGIQAGGGVAAGFATKPHLLFGYVRGDYSRFNHTTSVAKAFAHVRYNYEFTEWLWGELFAQMQSDEFQRLKLRTLFGVGPRFRVLHADTFDVYAGTAYMIERNVIAVAPGASDANEIVLARLSNYVTAHWDIDTRVVLATTLYVQPQISDFSNTRVLSENVFGFKVTKVLTASISGTVRYDSAPPSDVKTTDTEIKNSLSLVF